MATRSPCPPPLQLQSFALGKVSGADARSLNQHLAECNDCLAMYLSLPKLEQPTRAVESNDSTPRPPVQPTRALAAKNGTSTSPAALRDEYPYLRPPEAAGEVGRLGNYRVLRLLGQGGMAQVFHAEDLTLCRPVALKVIRPGLEEPEQAGKRFLREARALALVKHENVVTVYQAGQEGDAVFLAMELLEGQTLEDWLREAGPPPMAEVVRLGREIAGGLAAVHRHGLVHRDIKPANVWVEAPHRHVKLLDFGLTRSVQDEGRLTQSGLIVGTPAFMSPEQARGEALDFRSDLFSFGSVLYFLCTGVQPFAAPTTMAQLTALAVEDPRPLREFNPDVPDALVELVTALLAKRPEDRPASAEEVVERLRWLEGTLKRPPLSSPAVVPASHTPRDRTRVQPAVSVPSDRRRWRHLAVMGALLALVFVTGFVALVAGLIVILPRFGPPGGPPPWGGDPSAATLPAGEKDPKGQTFLSDLKPVAQVDWPLHELPPGAPPPPRFFERMSVQGRPVPHGLGLHGSPFGPVSVSYALHKRYDVFVSGIALNDSTHGGFSAMTFRVYGDGKELWKSRPVQRPGDGDQCRISVKGVDVLKLEMTCDGEIMGTHGLWVEPYVAKE